MGVSSGFLVASLEEGEDSESDGEGEEDWLSEVEACPQAVHDRPIRSVRIHRSLFSYGMLERVVEKDNIFIVAVGHQKAAGDHTQPGKAQLFVQVQGPFVAFYHGVKL